jgi:hypothetical protein
MMIFGFVGLCFKGLAANRTATAWLSPYPKFEKAAS